MESNLLVIKFKYLKTWASVEVQGEDLGEVLVASIASLLSLPSDALRIITARGKTLQTTTTMSSQGLKMNSKILVSRVQTDTQKKQGSEKLRTAEKTEAYIETAQKMSRKSAGSDGAYFELETENGGVLDVCEDDRAILSQALSLYEKGRVLGARGEYQNALSMFTEAQKAFQLYPDKGLYERVDNYARFLLDFVWVSMKNGVSLMDSSLSSKLREAFRIFQICYGKNNERLMRLKGATAELGIYVRLYLLLGILSFEENKFEESTSFLAKCQTQVQLVTVTPEDIIPLALMGFSEREARLGLRATGKRVHDATQWIFAQREQRKEKEAMRKERYLDREYGMTSNGSHIDCKMYTELRGLGFPSKKCANALQLSNNDVVLAMAILTDAASSNMSPSPVSVDDELLTQLVSLGFSVDQARAGLTHAHNDVNRAAEYLLNNPSASLPVQEESVDLGLPSRSSDSGLAPSKSNSESVKLADEEEARKKKREREKEEEEEDEFLDDLEIDDYTHLDLNIEPESELLARYLSKLSALA